MTENSDGDPVCSSCASDYSKCANCQILSKDEGFVSAFGEYICPDCKDYFEECHSCGKLHNFNFTDSDDNSYCIDCYSVLVVTVKLESIHE
jgi:hypothetical protein